MLKIAPFLLPIVLCIACSSSSSNGESTANGVDDLTKACEIRTTWTHLSSAACSQCLIRAPAARCPCDHEDYPGKCNSQQVAKNNEPSCKSVDDCLIACSAADCACIDACYQSSAACRPLGDAVDGCVTAACDAYCR